MTPETFPSRRSRAVTGDWLTAEDLAAEFNVTLRTIRNYIARGLPEIRLGSQQFFDPAAVREWLAATARRREPVRRGRPTHKRAA